MSSTRTWSRQRVPGQASQGERGLHSKIQDRLQNYPEKHCVKKNKQTNNRKIWISLVHKTMSKEHEREGCH